MRRLIPALVAALFAAVTFSAYAAQDARQTTRTHETDPRARRRNRSPRAFGSPRTRWTNPGKALAQSSGTGGVQAGAPAAEGRGTPTGQPAAGGGAVTSPTPKGAGRADNQ